MHWILFKGQNSQKDFTCSIFIKENKKIDQNTFCDVDFSWKYAFEIENLYQFTIQVFILYYVKFHPQNIKHRNFGKLLVDKSPGEHSICVIFGHISTMCAITNFFLFFIYFIFIYYQLKYCYKYSLQLVTIVFETI